MGASIQPIAKTAQTSERFLGFEIQADLQALVNLNNLQGAIDIELAEILPVPQMAPYLLGILNWRGKSTWIVDLARFMGGDYYRDRHPQNRKATVLILQAGKESIGFIVDRTIAVANYDLLAALPLGDNAVSPQIRSFLYGYFLDAEHKSWLLLDLDRIWQSMNFERN